MAAIDPLVGASRPATRVLALTRYTASGASSRYRVFQFLPRLTAQGVSVTPRALLDDSYVRSLHSGGGVNIAAVLAAYVTRLSDLLGSGRYDLLWIEGELFPWFPPLFERLLALSGVPYVVEYDDAWFHRYDHHAKRSVRMVLGGKIGKVMRHAARVIAGNAYIAEHARAAGASAITILPTAVDVQRYDATMHPAGAEVILGWIGSPKTSRYLEGIRAPLARLQAETGCRIHLIGADPQMLSGLDIAYLPWSEETETRDLAAIDIGLSPLPDTDWERGKCGLKAIQYMASGKPVIASPVGMHSALIGADNGFLADGDEAWYAALRRLHDDADLRQRLGRANRAKVEAEYDVGVISQHLADILHQTARRRS